MADPTLFQPRNPAFEARVRESFARQKMMALLGAELISVRAGEVEIALPYSEALTQQHGFLHAAAITAVADSACGYAAFSLMAAEQEVLSVEFKVNLLSPAVGDRFVAVGRVLRPGRTLTACTGEVWAEAAGNRRRVLQMQATMIATSLDEHDSARRDRSTPPS